MNEQPFKGQEHSRLNGHSSHKSKANIILEERIIQVLEEQASQIEFSTVLRNKVLQQHQSRKRAPFNLVSVPALGLAAILVLVLCTVGIVQFARTYQTPAQVIVYTATGETALPQDLAEGGRLVSLDPTEKHILYQPVGAPGKLSTADVQNPVKTHTLAMEYALDANWSPDGSALLATIAPKGVIEPLLALAHTGAYMKLVGPKAQTANWQPREKQTITYVEQGKGIAQLLSIKSDGSESALVTTMNVAYAVQHMNWSSDGSRLALVVTGSRESTPEALGKAGKGLYIMDVQSGKLVPIVGIGGSSIGKIEWSPDNRYLTYELIGEQGQIDLQTYDATTGKQVFSIKPKGKVEGWSWSPQSDAIVYSDAGSLHVYNLQRKNITFTQMKGNLISPFWLKDGRIVCMRMESGQATLAFLSAHK